jgi:hypothetical protein
MILKHTQKARNNPYKILLNLPSFFCKLPSVRNSNFHKFRRLKMKKLWVVLTIIMVFSLLSCGTQNENAANTDDQPEKAGQEDRRARMKKAIAEVKYDVPDEIDINYEVLENIDTSPSPLGVVPLPEELGKTLNGLFSKYTKHIAPNGTFRS